MAKAQSIAAIEKNDNKLFRLLNIRFSDMKELFTYKHEGRIIYLTHEGEFVTKKGKYLTAPDMVEYRVKAKILDENGSPLWCILFDKTATKLFGISANHLFDQIKKFNPNDESWKKELIATLKELRVNLVIQCRIAKWNDEVTQEKRQSKIWVVDQLEAVEIE